MRLWWRCHLLENGGVDDFTQLAVEFRDEVELRSSEWFDYVNRLYGIATLSYPLPLGTLTYFHAGMLPASAQGLHMVTQEGGTTGVISRRSSSTPSTRCWKHS